MTTGALLLKLASAALERGDIESAKELLLAVQALPAPDAVKHESPTAKKAAVTMKDFAALLSCSERHVANLIKRGAIPPDALVGSGRGRRILVDAALRALRPSNSNEFEAAGAEAMRRRRGLRVVGGGG